MATSQTQPTETKTNTKPVQVTVFDLKTFDKVTLSKDVTMPEKPTSLEDALAAVGNDKDVLLSVIYDGLCERTADEAKKDLSTFTYENDEGEEVTFDGIPCDEKKGKAINGVILGLAKAMGFDKSLSKEKKRELKESARDAIRQNPVMLKAFQG
jgi:hypothetical protein